MSLDTKTIEEIQNYLVKRRGQLEDNISNHMLCVSEDGAELDKISRYIDEFTKELELAEDAIRPTKENDL